MATPKPWRPRSRRSARTGSVHRSSISRAGRSAPVAEGASSATAAVVKRLSVEYATGAYRRDPVLKISEARRAVPHCIVQIDPDTIDDPGYRDRFYSYPGIRHELALVTRSGE